MFDTTDISYAGIATKLNSDSISGPTGIGWTDHAISHVLQNRHYAGMVFVGQECEGEHYRIGDTGDVVERKLFTASKPIVTKTKHQPLIDLELFDRVQVKITSKKANDRRPHTNTNREGFALTGCLVCGNCQGNMFAVNNCKNGSIRYQCRNASRNTSRGCSYWSASESEMLPYLLSAIDTSIIKQLADAPTIPTDDEQQRIDREIADIDTKLASIKARIKHASIDATLALADAITSLTDRRTQ